MLKCIAIDDEPIALGILRRYCDKRGGVILETFCSPRQGMERVAALKPDVVFLDIEMNGVSGIDLAKKLPPSTCLIFTTAYAHYALDGFEVDAVDFLHKPYFYDRFDRAMQKAEQWLKMHDLLNISESPERKLVLKSDYKNVSISPDSILYVESIDNYVRVHLVDGTSILSKIPLRVVSDQLPADDFIRIHRSYLVARNRIVAYNKSEVTLSKSGETLPVSKKYAAFLLSVMER
ncbi:MAG: LytR/AlgR family response regulator transcription factor [Candidatus Cryptobacteroides sp.]